MTSDHHVFKDSHIGKKLNILKSPRYPVPGYAVRLLIVNGFPLNIYFTRIRGKCARDKVEERGLACAVGTDNGLDRMFGHGKGDIINRAEPAEGLAHVLYFKKAHAPPLLLIRLFKKASLPGSASIYFR